MRASVLTVGCKLRMPAAVSSCTDMLWTQVRRHGAFAKAFRRFRLQGAVEIGMYEDSTETATDSCNCFGVQPNASVIRYLHWAFRSSFMAVILSAMAAFFSLTLFFGLIIMGIGLNKPDCIHVNGKDFGTTGATFLDAYALSWTTFSTVVREMNGSGSSFPAEV